MAFCFIVEVFLDCKYLFIDSDFDTSVTQVRQELLEIHQYKDRISFSSEAEFGKFWAINFTKRKAVADGHL